MCCIESECVDQHMMRRNMSSTIAGALSPVNFAAPHPNGRYRNSSDGHSSKIGLLEPSQARAA